MQNPVKSFEECSAEKSFYAINTQLRLRSNIKWLTIKAPFNIVAHVILKYVLLFWGNKADTSPEPSV